MANYQGMTRTNYFRVTDAERLKDIVNRIIWDDCDDGFFAERGEYYSFGNYGSIYGLRAPEDVDGENWAEDFADIVYEELQKIVPEGSAIIITEIGNEKLRYLTAYSVVITSVSIRFVNLDEEAVFAAREELNDCGYMTEMMF